MGTPDADFSLEGPPDTAFEAYDRRYRYLGDIEFDNSSRLMELRHRLDNLQQHYDRLQSSLEVLVDSSEVDPPKQRKSPSARRKKLQSAVRLDLEALKYHLDELERLTDELRSSDRRQEQAERSFEMRPCIEKYLTERDLIMRHLVERNLIENQSDRTPQPLIAYELEAYYSAVSALRNMGERIGELESEQQEQWERRGVMEDQGYVLDQSEDDFLRHWNNTLSMANQDFERAQGNVVFARKSCEHAGIAIPAWAEIGSGEQQPFDDAGRTEAESQSLGVSAAQLKHVVSWHESAERGSFEYRRIWDDTSTPHTTPALGRYFSRARKKRPCNFHQLARSCFPLIAAAVPLVAARSNEGMVQDALPPETEPGGLHSPRNGQKEMLSTVFESTLAISPPLILIGGIAVSVWILTREKRAFERQHFLFLMTLAASVSWWVLAATAPGGEQGNAVSISTWLALVAIYTSRNVRGLRKGTWHLFVTLLGGLAITSLSALALLTAKEASMERFIRNALIVGPSVVTLWSWLAARGQREIEGSVTAVTQESIELQGSTNANSQ